jgi:hypothetical protein
MIKVATNTITADKKKTAKALLTVSAGIFFLCASTDCRFRIIEITPIQQIANVVVRIPPAVDDGAEPINIHTLKMDWEPALK